MAAFGVIVGRFPGASAAGCPGSSLNCVMRMPSVSPVPGTIGDCGKSLGVSDTALLARERLTPTLIRTTASVHLAQAAGGFTIPKIELVSRAQVPGVTAERFAALAADAKGNCPVSKALAGAEITLDAALE